MFEPLPYGAGYILSWVWVMTDGGEEGEHAVGALPIRHEGRESRPKGCDGELDLCVPFDRGLFGNGSK